MEIRNLKLHKIKVNCITITREPYRYLQVSAMRTLPLRIETLFYNVVPNQRKLLQLNPVLEKSLIKLNGRLKQVNIPSQSKHQIIPPGNHHVTSLINQHYYDTTYHSERDQKFSLICQDY